MNNFFNKCLKNLKNKSQKELIVGGLCVLAAVGLIIYYITLF